MKLRKKLQASVELGLRVTQAVGRLSFPLYGRLPGKAPRHVGTCFFVCHRQVVFCVTAKHIMTAGPPAEEIFCYSDETNIFKLPRDCSGYSWPDATLENDAIDVALLKVSAASTSCIADRTLTTDALELSSHLVPIEGFYQVVAPTFTSVRVREAVKTIKGHPRAYIANEVSFEKGAAGTLLPECNLLFNFDPKWSLGFDGKKRRNFKPEGWSGAPVWLIDRRYTTGEECRPKIAGVIIESVGCKKAIAATRSAILIHLMDKFISDLAGN